MDKPQPKRRRARQPDGSFRGDSPTTPGNEAWEPVEVIADLTEKTVKYEVKPQISGPSTDTAGKYSKKSKVRPTFGKVTTTFN